ncbi:MAG: hypothetical protein J0665_10775 [Deltaproteobacteria bacterium]|nr:hypothetical protein [Deltaproteobacteria bacterium]
MSDQPEKKPRGRQLGWRKPNAMPSRIPAMRIPAQLEEWLTVEAEKRGLKIVDMARMLLLEAMRGSEDGTSRPS